MLLEDGPPSLWKNNRAYDENDWLDEQKKSIIDNVEQV